MEGDKDQRADVKISDPERKVLEARVFIYSEDDWGAYGFKALVWITKLDTKEVRKSCRSLAKKGLSRFERSLWDEVYDRPAGAGYRATREGAAFIMPCDICGDWATYDYNVGLLDGKLCTIFGVPGKDVRRVLECEDHYTKSANSPQQIPLIT